MLSIEIDEKPDTDWNKRLMESDLGTIYQTKEMATFFEKHDRRNVFLKFVDNKGCIVAQLMISVIERFEKKGFVGSLLKKIPKSKKEVYQWTYGPVLFDISCAEEVYIELGKYLLSRNCRVSGWLHPLSPNGVSVIKNKFQIQMWTTFLIDLTKAKDEIYKNIDKHSGQKNIERSIKRGVVIEQIDKNNLIDYYNLRSKEMGEDFGSYENMLDWWNTLEPLGYSGFLARKDNVPMGGLMFSYVSKHIIEGGVARSEEDRINKLYSHDLIKWKIIEWGKENKMKYYNLAGANPKPQSSKEEGILRYKEKWGGKRYDYWIVKK